MVERLGRNLGFSPSFLTLEGRGRFGRGALEGLRWSRNDAYPLCPRNGSEIQGQGGARNDPLQGSPKGLIFFFTTCA